MKGASTFAIAASLFSTYTEAINLVERANGAPRVVGFPVQRKEVSNPLLRDRLRRRSTTTIQATLDNEVSYMSISAIKA
jgi:RNase P protein component